MLSAPKHARYPGECTRGMHRYPPGEAGVLGEQSDLGRETPQQWVGMPHARPPNPQEPPRTPAESQGRRLARQKSLPPSVSGLKSPEKPRFRQFFPCETTSRTLNRGRTSSVSGSIGPCVGSLNSQDTHHVRDTLGLPSIGTKVLRYSPVKLELGVNKSIGKTYGVSKMGSIPQL